jgi:hypothetical protein
MSQEERDWLEWLKRAQDGVVTQRQAAEKMGGERSVGAQAAGTHENGRRRSCGARTAGPVVERGIDEQTQALSSNC